MTTTKQETGRLEVLAAMYAEKLHGINQLTLTKWLSLANELGVETNDRDEAAMILAHRELASQQEQVA